MIAARRELIEPWPDHPDLPGHGVVLRRDVLDETLRDRARATGASVLMGHEAMAPVVERGFVRGALLDDGRRRAARSGRASSSSPTAPTAGSAAPSAPPATATGRTASPPAATGTAPARRHVVGDAARRSPTRNGNPIAGYGWIAPGRRRHGQRRRRAAVVLPRRARGERAEVARRVRPAGRRRAGRSTPATPLEVTDPLPGAARRFGRPDDGPDVPRRRRRRRRRQPVQRRRRERRVDRPRPPPQRGAE